MGVYLRATEITCHLTPGSWSPFTGIIPRPLTWVFICQKLLHLAHEFRSLGTHIFVEKLLHIWFQSAAIEGSFAIEVFTARFTLVRLDVVEGRFVEGR